jgi:hypothetical protein
MFSKNANFASTQYDALVKFQDDSFKSKTSFYFARFKDVIFASSTFFNNVDFRIAHFDGATNFVRAIFRDTLNLHSAHIRAQVYFENTSINTIDFSDISDITYRVDFTQCKKIRTAKSVDDYIHINLTCTKVNWVKINYTNFRLFFDPGASWEQKENVYDQLLKNFKDDGYTESYELLDKEYRIAKYKQQGNYLFLLLDYCWWDFGYKKWLVFVWIVLFIGLFTIITFFVYPEMRQIYYVDIQPKRTNHEDAAKVEIPYNQLSKLQKLYVSFLYSAIIFFSLNVKKEEIVWRPKRYVFYLFVMYSLGLICLGYAVNFILQK